MSTAPRLTAEEDGQLRRLHFFELAGAHLAEPFQELKIDLRRRDLRKTIREPQDAWVLQSA